MGFLSSILIASATFKIIVGTSPILIVPGLTGSQLEAKVHTLNLCNTFGKWKLYWVTANPSRELCIPYVAKLEYNPNEKTYSNRTGVEVRVPGFGDTVTVEFLRPNAKKPKNRIPYFHDFVDYFVRKGYRRGDTIRAAPYDWRLAADELERLGYYAQLQNLIEEMYSKQNQPVTVVVHSMGGPVTLYFFNKVVTQSWKDKYIRAFVPLSGAWSGGNKAVLALLSGLEAFPCPPHTDPIKCLDLKFIDHYITPVAKSLESLLWMMPSPTVSDQVIVITKERHYTPNDYVQLLKDFNMDKTYETRLQDVLEINNYMAPNVPVYCLYGVGVETAQTFDYRRRGINHNPYIINGDGDGTVNTILSEVCKHWKYQHPHFEYQTFSGLSHVHIVSDERIFKKIAAIAGVPDIYVPVY